MATSAEQGFRLPDLGEGLTEAELLSWRVAVGDQVELNQIIAEVETAKAAVELPSPFAGRVVALRCAEGDTVEVGAEIIVFATAGGGFEPGSDPAGGSEAGAKPGTEEERVPVLVGYGATSGTSSRRGRGRVTGLPEALGPASARPLAKPLVRKLARDNGLDLAEIRGTGRDGIVTRQDVLDHLARRAAPAATPSTSYIPAPAQLDGDERLPIRGIRKATAAAMVRSAFTAPHVTEFVTVDVTPTVELLNRLKGSAFADGVKLTPLAFVAKALLAGLPANPTLNSAWDEQAQEIVLHRQVNLGIAAATPRGLVVPNIKDAGRLGLIELARALDQLAVTAKEGHATPADLTGGTISITNVGMFGIDTGTPIINPGEAAILCLGAVRQQPWVVDGELAVRWVTTLGLSFDHRLVDGEQGSRFLADVAGALARG